MGLHSLKWEETIVRQQPNHPVWEHLVIELAKVDQSWSRAVGTGRGFAIMGVPSGGCTLYRLGDRCGGVRFALRELQ